MILTVGAMWIEAQPYAVESQEESSHQEDRPNRGDRCRRRGGDWGVDSRVRAARFANRWRCLPSAGGANASIVQGVVSERLLPPFHRLQDSRPLA